MKSLRETVVWTARALSLISILTMSLIAFGNGTSVSWSEAIGLLFFPGGVVLGMIAAWYREALGGAISVASLAGFYSWHYTATGRFPAGPYFLVFTLPGILFLIAAAMPRVQATPR